MGGLDSSVILMFYEKGIGVKWGLSYHLNRGFVSTGKVETSSRGSLGDRHEKPHYYTLT